MENPVDQRGKKVPLQDSGVFFCERSPVNTALSRSMKLFNNSCFSQKFLESHSQCFPQYSTHLAYIPIFWQRDHQLVMTEGLGLGMPIFELERFKSRDTVNKKFPDIRVCSGNITMSS